MAEPTVLNLVLLLPLAGIAGLRLLSMSGTAAGRDRAVRGWTLGVMLVQFVLTAWLYVRFDATATETCAVP